MNCPKCSGTNIQKVHLAYESGTSSIDTTTIGAGVGTGGVGLGIGGTTGTQTTKLAEKLAPPDELGLINIFCALMTVGGWAYIISGLGNIIGISEWTGAGLPWYGHVWAILWFIFGSIIGWDQIKYYFGDGYANDMEEWKKKWFCHSCGWTGHLEKNRTSKGK